MEIKEVVYQAVPYVGMAKVFDFLHATNEALTDRGIALPLPGQSKTTPDTRAETGRRSRGRSSATTWWRSVIATASADQLHIEHFLSANCFGDYITRAGIDLPTRELLTLSMLVASAPATPRSRAMWRRTFGSATIAPG